MATIFNRVSVSVLNPIGTMGFGYLIDTETGANIYTRATQLSAAGFDPDILKTAVDLLVDYREENSGRFSLSRIHEVDGVKAIKPGSKRQQNPRRHQIGDTGIGTVKFYDEKRGFAFLEVEGKEDIFSHISRVPKPLKRGFQKGRKYTYVVAKDVSGKRGGAVRMIAEIKALA